MDNPAFSHESPTSVTSLPSAPAFTERQLRDALGQFATGVTIVTTSNAQGAPAGMTVSSFNAVSLDPPLVLWSLGQATALYPVFLRSQHYAIHVLALEQEDLARRFAAKGGDRFAQVDWQPNAEGVPIISGAVAVFECALRHRYAGGITSSWWARCCAVSARGGSPCSTTPGNWVGALPRRLGAMLPQPMGRQQQTERFSVRGRFRAARP